MLGAFDAKELLLVVLCRDAYVDPYRPDAEVDAGMFVETGLLPLLPTTGPDTERVDMRLEERLVGMPEPTTRGRARSRGPTIELGLPPLEPLTDMLENALMRRDAAMELEDCSAPVAL